MIIPMIFQALLEMREKLHSSWQSRNEYLLQLVKQQIFYRDLSHLESASTAQENYLQNQDLGNSVQVMRLEIRSVRRNLGPTYWFA